MATCHLNGHHLIQLVSDITITCPPHIYNLVAPARASDPELTKKMELQTPAARGMFAPNLKYFQMFCPYSRVFRLIFRTKMKKKCSANKDLFSLKKNCCGWVQLVFHIGIENWEKQSRKNFNFLCDTYMIPTMLAVNAASPQMICTKPTTPATF